MSVPRRSSARPVVEVDHVYKAYRPKGHQVNLRHEALQLLSRRLRGGNRSDRLFWALHDISFEVNRGESVALIGRNGSGKTTLLRVLAHITRPTRGGARIEGRFAALIGLGAGFNFERTGRENIYLNAAIHGVLPREVARHISAIERFAELGNFIDVPVKRYSTGMITRLGFSIAAHIFPDIVFIDEVLAVGDMSFQERCIERIHWMKREERTLLFVSHDPGLVRQLCDRCIWLEGGHLRADGPTETVLTDYERDVSARSPGS